MRLPFLPRPGFAVPLACLLLAPLAGQAALPLGANSAAPPTALLTNGPGTGNVTVAETKGVNTGIVQIGHKHVGGGLASISTGATEPVRTVALTDQAEITPRPQNGTLGATLLGATVLSVVQNPMFRPDPRANI